MQINVLLSYLLAIEEAPALASMHLNSAFALTSQFTSVLLSSRTEYYGKQTHFYSPQYNFYHASIACAALNFSDFIFVTLLICVRT